MKIVKKKRFINRFDIYNDGGRQIGYSTIVTFGMAPMIRIVMNDKSKIPSELRKKIQSTIKESVDGSLFEKEIS